MTTEMQLLHGDCLELMKNIPDNSIDMVLCDLPYGVTSLEWDAVIPLDKLRDEYKRITKPYANVLLFCQQPFTTTLINSMTQGAFRYMLYWNKPNFTSSFLAHIMPQRCIEEIALFRFDDDYSSASANSAVLEYMLGEKARAGGLGYKEWCRILGNTSSRHYFTASQFNLPTKENYKKLQDATGCFNRPWEELKQQMSKGALKYYPELIKIDKPRKYKLCKTPNTNYRNIQQQQHEYTTEYTGFPTNLLQFGFAPKERHKHPTQKPVSLLEYLIKLYTLEGETVLDNCMGSGSTGVACVNTSRRFIGIEKEDTFYKTAKERIEEATRARTNDAADGV